ncbi:hypothetical protein EI94DRAFT_1702448 [Lactarius quietus]|nr:hypothetical protein EI94DRAFT_1702448 [Lactarius quietus]
MYPPQSPNCHPVTHNQPEPWPVQCQKPHVEQGVRKKTGNVLRGPTGAGATPSWKNTIFFKRQPDDAVFDVKFEVMIASRTLQLVRTYLSHPPPIQAETVVHGMCYVHGTLAIILSCMNDTLSIRMEVLLGAQRHENSRSIAILVAPHFGAFLAVAVFDRVKASARVSLMAVDLSRLNTPTCRYILSHPFILNWCAQNVTLAIVYDPSPTNFAPALDAAQFVPILGQYGLYDRRTQVRDHTLSAQSMQNAVKDHQDGYLTRSHVGAIPPSAIVMVLHLGDCYKASPTGRSPAAAGAHEG